MKHMTLRQRRRHRELAGELERMRNNPYLFVPEDYEVGKDPAEDDKYRETIDRFNRITAEMHELEQIGRRGY